MIKKIITPATAAILFWLISLLIVNQYYYQYLKPFLYLSIIIAIAYVVIDKIKEDNDQ